MAITENRRMQQLRGKYADLDKTKMLVGEIAVPSDHSPIMKVDTDKYIELVSSEDTEYIEKVTENLNNALADVNQLAIDKVGINDNSESLVQTYSSRKIEEMHNAQAEEITNQFKTVTGTEITATDTSKGFVTDFSMEGKTEQNGTPTSDVPIAMLNSGECVEMMQGVYQTNSGILTTSGITTYLCNKYPVPCKSGDVLAISVELATIKGVHFLFYNESGYISYSTVFTTSGSVTVPSDATYFNIDIVGADGVEITTETVGKVELTINNKYVLQIKSCNKNELVNTATSQTVNGVTFTVNADKSVTVSGTSTSSDNTWFRLNRALSLKAGTYILGKNVSKNAWLYISTITTTYQEEQTFTLTEDKAVDLSIVVPPNATTNVTIYPMIRKTIFTDNTFALHAESISTLLLDEPLRANDLIAFRDNAYATARKMKSIIFDGVTNKFTYKSSSPTNNGYQLDVSLYSDIKPIADGNAQGNILCSHAVCKTNAMLYNSGVTGISQTVSGTTQQIYFWFGVDSDITTLDLANEWLASNPITVQYEMAEEVIEKIADQTLFYSIQTHEGGTTISTTDRLQPQIEVEYPTNRVAGVASEAYKLSNTRKASRIINCEPDHFGAISYSSETKTITLSNSNKNYYDDNYNVINDSFIGNYASFDENGNYGYYIDCSQFDGVWWLVFNGSEKPYLTQNPVGGETVVCGFQFFNGNLKYSTSDSEGNPTYALVDNVIACEDIRKYILIDGSNLVELGG